MTESSTCPGECGGIVKVWLVDDRRYVNFCCVACWVHFREASEDLLAHSEQCNLRQVARWGTPLVERPPNIMGPIEWRKVKDAQALAGEGTKDV